MARGGRGRARKSRQQAQQAQQQPQPQTQDQQQAQQQDRERPTEQEQQQGQQQQGQQQHQGRRQLESPRKPHLPRPPRGKARQQHGGGAGGAPRTGGVRKPHWSPHARGRGTRPHAPRRLRKGSAAHHASLARRAAASARRAALTWHRSSAGAGKGTVGEGEAAGGAVGGAAGADQHGGAGGSGGVAAASQLERPAAPHNDNTYLMVERRRRGPSPGPAARWVEKFTGATHTAASSGAAAGGAGPAHALSDAVDAYGSNRALMGGAMFSGPDGQSESSEYDDYGYDVGASEERRPADDDVSQADGAFSGVIIGENVLSEGGDEAEGDVGDGEGGHFDEVEAPVQLQAQLGDALGEAWGYIEALEKDNRVLRERVEELEARLKAAGGSDKPEL